MSSMSRQPSQPIQPTVTDPADLVERVRRLVDAVDDGHRVIIGLVGEPGAGKSTVSAGLVDELAARGIAAMVVPMDGFHLANVELRRLGRADRKGAMDTFDAAGFLTLLRRLRAPLGAAPGTIYAPYFDRGLEESIGSAIPIEPDARVLITEGNYLLADEPVWREVRELLDECWYVDVEQELRLGRLIGRHIEHGRTPEAAREWVMRSDEKNAELIRTTKGRADLIVSLP